MSGAAGALVPLAPANRLSRIMSALTLLSVIAPVVPSAPQGSSGEAASGFQDLLAALAGEAGGAPGAKADPAETPAPDETQADAPVAAGFLIAPAPPPVPMVLPAAEESPPEAGSAGSAGSASGDGEAAAAAPLSPTPAVAAEEPGATATTPLPPAGKGLTSKTVEPQVQPLAPDSRPSEEPAPDGPATLAGIAATTEAVQAMARTGAAPAPSSLLPATPPPLRPLAERTSKPVDAPTAKASDLPGVADPARPATPPAAAPPAAAPPAAPPDAIAAAIRDTSNGGEAESPASELPPVGDGAAAQTQGPAAARETGVSQLSRATIEATAQIAAQILRRLEGRSTRFEMALTPDELGRVDVKLDIDSEGRLNARLAFDNPAAATDLRGRADELRRQLEDAGFHLADDAFEFAERDSGSSAFDRGQDARNGQSRAFTAASRLNAEIDVAQPPRWMALSLSPSGVDMKV